MLWTPPDCAASVCGTERTNFEAKLALGEPPSSEVNLAVPQCMRPTHPPHHTPPRSTEWGMCAIGNGRMRAHLSVVFQERRAARGQLKAA